MKSKFKPKEVLVTVGSTSFDELIQAVTSPYTVDQLKTLGCKKLTLQTGKYVVGQKKSDDLQISCYDYSKNLNKDIEKADLVIGHAGAGTCLEVLRQKKRLLVVTNDGLMDSHQDELANTLDEGKYLVATKLKDFHKNLDLICSDKLEVREFPSREDSKFEGIFNSALKRALA